MLTGNPIVDVEPNDTFNEATDIGSGDRSGTELMIGQSGDVDNFRWTAPDSGVLNVDVLFRDVYGDLDVALYDSSTVRVARSDTLTDNEHISYNVTAGGVYFIRVYGFGESSNTYDLIVDGPEPGVVVPPDRFEVNDSSTAASDLGSNDQSQANLTIHTFNDEDWYKWTASAAGNLTVDVLFSHANGNIDAQLLDANQNLLKSSVSTTDNEQLSHTVAAGQVYFVRVFTPGSQTQANYSLTIDGPQSTPANVQIIDDGDPGFATAGDWNVSTQVGFQNDIHISAPATVADVATWTFAVTPGKYRVAATWLAHPGRETDVQFAVLDGSNQLAVVNIDQVQLPDDFTDQGATWEYLGGLYNITSNSLTVRLSDGSDVFIIADAVRIEKVDDTVLAPEIEVSVGATEILDGGTVNFGTTTLSVLVDKVLTVRNAGTANLTLVPLNGSQLPVGYQLISNFGSTNLAPGASTTFAIRLVSSTSGTFGGLVSFGNNDANESPFDLNLAGTVSNVHIIDDGDAGFSAVGQWTVAGGGFQNDIRFNSPGNGSDLARWMFNVTPGTYRIAATWSPNQDRATDAPFTILDGPTSRGTIDVNQQQAPNDFTDQGASWEYLDGTFDVTGNTLVVELSDNANQLVIADAIRVERVSQLSPEIEVLTGATVIADGAGVDFGTTASQTAVDKVFTVRNVGAQTLTLTPLSPSAFPNGFTLQSNISATSLGPGQSTQFTVRFQATSVGTYGGSISFGNNDANENPFDLVLSGKVASAQIMDDGDAGFSTIGSWPASTTGGFQGDSLINAAGNGSDVARWQFAVTPGQYRVSATWSAAQNLATDAPYTILDGTTVMGTVKVNQQQFPNDLADLGGIWEDLGGPYNISGTNLVIQLSDNANQNVSADAIRIERVGQLSPEIEVLSGTTVIADGGSVDFGSTAPQIAVDRVFTVRNIGLQNLTLSPPSASAFPIGFTLHSNITSTTLAPGQSTQFTVRFKASTVGTYGGSISFGNNDADENPFDLVLSGNVKSNVVTTQIMDDGDAGFSSVGEWRASNLGGYQGDSLINSKGNASDVATWKFTVTPGQYRVSATWQAAISRSTDAPFTILDGTTVVGAVDINQELAPNDRTDQGASWEDLGGPYHITGNSLVVKLSDDADDSVNADAIRIEWVGELRPEIEVLDGTTVIADGANVNFGTASPQAAVDKIFTVRNVGAQNLSLTPLSASAFPTGFTLVSNITSTTLAPGQSTKFTVRFQSATVGSYGGSISFSNNDADENPFDLLLKGSVSLVTTQIIDDGDAGFSTVGEWRASNLGGYQGDSLINSKGNASDVATWKFTVTPGQYRVSATWQAAISRSTDAPFTILDGTTVVGTVDINQELAPNDRTDQGASWEDLGGPYHISGNSLVVKLSDDANDFINADAIRIERVGELRPEIEVLDGATVIADGANVNFGTASPQAAVDKIFTVRNVGAQNLSLSPLSASAFPTGFTLLSDITSTVLAPGQSTKFTIRFQSATVGTYGGSISFNNNDADENPFDMLLKGNVSLITTQIIDDGDAGFSTVGEWRASNLGGYQGDSLINSKGNASDVATWKFTVTPGQYRVSATWQAAISRSTDAPFTILDGTTVVGTVDINQELAPNDRTDQGANWEDLGGPYHISGNSLVVRLSDEANDLINADAIRIERVGELRPEIEVLDGTTVIADGANVNFGTASPQAAVDKIFTVRNVGAQNLSLSPLSASAFPTGFTLVSNITSTVLAPGQSTKFTIRLQSATVGTYGGSISFNNSDVDENPFDLVLAGNVNVVSTQILDDGDAGFSTVGEWRASSFGGYQGDSLINSKGNASDVATWQFTVTPGQYRVSATWQAAISRSTDAPFTILDGTTVVGTVDINQELAPNDRTDQGANWEDLGGPYNITGNSLVVRLSDDANDLINADAIRIEWVGQLRPEIEVLDAATVITDGGTVNFGTAAPQAAVDKVFTVRNVGAQNLSLSPLSASAFPTGFTLLSNITSTLLTPGQSTNFTVRFQSATVGTYGGSISFGNNDADENPFDLVLSGRVASVQIKDDGDTGFSTTGNWLVSTSGGYHGDSLYNATGSGNDMARWTFDVTPGRFRVSATWAPGTNRATDAPFTILDGTTVLWTVDINQQQAPDDFTDLGSSWEQLDGTFDVTSNTIVVQLTDDANNVYVSADAIRIERIGDTGGGQDGFEPNNSFDTATLLETGDQLHNDLAINPNGDQDFFRWTAPASGSLTVDIFFVDDDGDLELSLYNSNRILLTKADSVTDNERITQSVVGGETYFIHVFPAGGAVNQYDLLIDGPEGSGGNSLTVDVTEGSISENGGSSQATVTRNGTSGSLTVNLSSSDTTEAIVPSQVTIPNGSTLATFTVTSVNDTLIDGTQSVTITASANGFGNGYDTILVTDDDNVVPGDDHGNNASTSTFVPVPSTTPGRIEVGGDSDWFRFSAVAGTQYALETTLSTLGDSILALYGTDGVTQLRLDDDGGAGTASLIQWSPTTSGTYYLEVRGFNAGYTGHYNLLVRTENPVVVGPAEPNGSFEEASNLSLGDQVYRNLAIDGDLDEDYYRWVAPQSGPLAVDILFVDSVGDLDLKLYSSSRVRVAISDSLTDNEHVAYNVVGGEVYFIHVYGFGGSSNVYDLIIDGP